MRRDDGSEVAADGGGCESIVEGKVIFRTTLEVSALVAYVMTPKNSFQDASKEKTGS